MGASRTAVMTGASRGLGWRAAVAMLERDPELHLAVTTRAGSNGAVADRLAAVSGNEHVSEVDCDLSSLAGVAAAAKAVRQREQAGDLPPIHVLVANAGTQLTTGSQASADGLEMTFAVNVLANVAFIRALSPAISPPGRIVITSSDTHFGDFRHNMGMVAGPRWRHPAELSRPGTEQNSSAGQVAYSTSKLAVIYLVHALARRLPAGVDVYSFNPGLVPGTGLARDRDLISRIGWKAIMPMVSLTPLAMSANKAGQLLATAATGPKPGETGAYIDRRQVVDSSPESYDPEREEQLWTTAVKLLEACAQNS
jgi:NAD(P)-dependent dehydrogenase (short-subunit alcohol dehydrogenase family)